MEIHFKTNLKIFQQRRGWRLVYRDLSRRLGLVYYQNRLP